jgi:DNA-binding CsgD family transcriptional regulator/PAS domain-containing protein
VRVKIASESLAQAQSRNLWADWTLPAGRGLPVVLPAGDDEVRPLMETVLAALEGDAALLTLHMEGDGSPPVIVERVGAADLSDQEWGQVVQLAEGADRRFPGTHWDPAELDYLVCLLNQGAWQVLRVVRVAIGSRRARSRVVLSVLFGKAAPPKREQLAGTVQQLRPMMESYFRLWQRNRALGRVANGLRSALNAMEIGVILVERSTRIAFTNRLASELLAEGDHLRRNGDWLAATDLSDAVMLQVALNDAVASNGDGEGARARQRRAAVLALRSPGTDRCLILCVVPCDDPATEDRVRAAGVYLLDPAVVYDEQLHPVCNGLSPVETRLFCLITAGSSLQEAATAMRIKEQTARSYLKQVFLKTDTKRQADLVRVILCSLVRTNSSLPIEVIGGAR